MARGGPELLVGLDLKATLIKVRSCRDWGLAGSLKAQLGRGEALGPLDSFPKPLR